MTTGRIEDPGNRVRRLWGAEEIGTEDYLESMEQRVNARSARIRLTRQLWKAWLEFLQASDELETGLNKLAGPDLIRAISANPPKKWYRLARLRNPPAVIMQISWRLAA